MEHLPQHDLAVLLDFLHALYSAPTVAEVQRELVMGVRRIVAADFASYVETDARRRPLATRTDPPDAIHLRNSEEILREHLHESPLFSAYTRGQGLAVMMSDFLAVRELQRLRSTTSSSVPSARCSRWRRASRSSRRDHGTRAPPAPARLLRGRTSAAHSPGALARPDGLRTSRWAVRTPSRRPRASAARADGDGLDREPPRAPPTLAALLALDKWRDRGDFDASTDLSGAAPVHPRREESP